jgi:hypothetical protein
MHALARLGFGRTQLTRQKSNGLQLLARFWGAPYGPAGIARGVRVGSGPSKA